VTLTLRSKVKIKDQIFHFTINPEQLNRLLYNSKVKIKGQNFHFAINPNSFLSISLKIAPYNNHIKLNKEKKSCALDTKIKVQNPRSNISFCD